MDKNGLWIIILIAASAAGGIALYDARTSNKLDKLIGGKANWKWTDDWTEANPTEPIAQIQPTSPVPPPTAPITGPQIIAASYKDALKRSRETLKPILVMFGADWCTWCKKMESEVLTDPQVKTMLKNYVYVKINVDVDGDVARKFSVSKIPAFVITHHQEPNLKSGTGYMAAPEFATWLNNPELFKVPNGGNKNPSSPPEGPEEITPPEGPEEITPPPSPPRRPDRRPLPNRPEIRPRPPQSPNGGGG